MLEQRIILSNMVGVDTHMREVLGQEVECVSIPIELNGITVNRKGKLILHLYLFERAANLYKQVYYMIVKYRDVALYKKLKELGYLSMKRTVGNVYVIKNVFNNPNIKNYSRIKPTIDEVMDNI